MAQSASCRTNSIMAGKRCSIFRTRLPDVRDAGFAAEGGRGDRRACWRCTEGRAFCLFTSYSQMNQVFELVRAACGSLCCCKGRRRASALLERFRMTPGAVLFATSSFWQGVDVPGEQLSCVIVDRLPFAVPTDPVVAARVRL